MDIHNVHIQRGQGRHGLFDSVGNVMELEIQKDLVSPRPDLPDNRGAFRIEQLHADLHKGLFLRKLIQKSQRLFPAVEIQRNDNVLTHDVLLL